MKVERTDTRDLECTLKLTIEPQDYLPVFNEEFKKVKTKVAIKGFRKGKTPDRVVKKMYGNSIFVEKLEKLFQDRLFDYIKEQKIEYVCQPLPSADQAFLSPNISDSTKVYEFSYDLGLIPEFEVKGADTSTSFDYFTSEVPESEIQKEVDNLALSFGGHENVNDAIQQGDRLTLSAVELEGEGGEVKKDGWETNFEVNANVIADKELRESLIGKEVGYTFDFQMSKLTFSEAEEVKSKFLQVEEGDNREIGDFFRFKVETISRVVPAVLTDELIEENLGMHNLQTVEEYKERVRENKARNFQGMSDTLLYTEIMEAVKSQTQFDLSDTFIKRWLGEVEKLDETKIAEMYESFLADLKWTIIRRKLEEKYDIRVEMEDIREYFSAKAEQFMNRMGFYDESIFKRVFERMIQDRNEIYKAENAISADKIFTRLSKEIVKVESVITPEELQAKLNNIQPQAPAHDHEHDHDHHDHDHEHHDHDHHDHKHHDHDHEHDHAHDHSH